MIEIEGKIVSRDVFDKQFVCDLNACKGACCVLGDSGAPLEEEEAGILEDIFDDIKPFLREEGIRAIEEQGKWEIDDDGDLVTPLVDGKECVYTIFENGIAGCGIEKAFRAGKTDFRKPVSCHLYPVRIRKYRDFEAVNYDRWDICQPACTCGEKLQVPVFRFLKDALTRKYGEEWYAMLDEAGRMLENGTSPS